ncbi:hypothetical protein FEM48_Zijuj08G0071200 [Ziziphus jujuba var. spinosa]|uniref:Single-stranded DNA-bindig protein WHY2, mitochondrial n=1 Tax=Ziziphus jujuba var. spinosa TaxID=714518 RepID=A0A978UXP3_ZIZJJ|nr:hypothetical protein FEM48_Zijuj08G0071200 [Ziziphus jujuba var. spinosa]
MMKLSSRLIQHSRNQLSRKLLYGKDGDVKDVLSLHSFSHRAGISTSGQNIAVKGSIGDRIFAPYTIFKGKAALSVAPMLPTFTKLESGSLVVDRRGSIMLTFMPAIGERKYDRERRQVFSLSATEVGSLISLGADESCEFFHDPSMLTRSVSALSVILVEMSVHSRTELVIARFLCIGKHITCNAGQVRKSLSIKPHGNGSGYFIALSVVNNLLKSKDNLGVPVTTAEFAVMKTACSFALPHIMGWDRLTNKMPRGTEGQTSMIDRQALSLEWDK